MKIRNDILGNVFDKDIEVCDQRDIEDDGWTTVWPPPEPRPESPPESPAAHPDPSKVGEARVKRD